jgi:thymidylate synthase
MFQYLDVLRKIIDKNINPNYKTNNGVSVIQDELYLMPDAFNWQMNNRTGERTIRIASGVRFEHDMADGFPLLTTKKMGLQSVFTELYFFLHGITDKKWLQDRKCKIWNQWARPSVVNATFAAQKEIARIMGDEIDDKELHDKIADEERDLGPIYGFQWRHFGAKYKFNPANPLKNWEGDYAGVDQVQNVIDLLRRDPSNRRAIVSAWNPVDIPDMALPPCHIEHQLLIDKGKLNLIWKQRSCDMLLGIPYNIASYAMLLKLYAKELGYKEGMLVGNWADVHIYEHHLPQVLEQLSRSPRKLPSVEIPDVGWKGMLDWQHKEFAMSGYNPMPAIHASVTR